MGILNEKIYNNFKRKNLYFLYDEFFVLELLIRWKIIYFYIFFLDMKILKDLFIGEMDMSKFSDFIVKYIEFLKYVFKCR